jgi:DNA modification methylase
MKIVKRKITELIAAEYNPRKINKVQEQDLKDSLTRFGLVDPIIININKERKNIVIGGHQRLRVWADLGNTEIDCNQLDLTLDKERELNIRLNKNGGSFDDELVKEYFDYEELTEWGFTPDELFDKEETTADGLIDDDEIPEAKESRVVLGDIWKLGKHKIMCGDSTSLNDVEKLMNGEKAQLAHNDPPYGMKKENDGVLNDNLNYNDLLNFNNQWIPLQFNQLKDNGSFYCWGIDEPLMDIYSNILKPYAKEQKLTFRNLITWNKGHGQSQNSELTRSYATADEKCLFVMMGVQGFNNNKDNYFDGFENIRKYLENEKNKMNWSIKDVIKITGKSSASHYFTTSQWIFPTKEHYNSLKIKANNDVFKKEYDEIKKEYDEIKKEYYSTRAYFNNTHDNMNNVWNIQRTSQKERETVGGHVTPKPLELCERVINSSSEKNEIILDFFLGSGSTLIAAEKLNRKCYGMELDEKYCDVIIERWEQFTGLKAEKING